MKTYDRAISLKSYGWMYDDYDYEDGDTFEDYAKSENMDMLFSSEDEIEHDAELLDFKLYCILFERDIYGMAAQHYAIVPGEYVKTFIKSIKKDIDCDGRAYYIFKMEDGKYMYQ